METPTLNPVSQQMMELINKANIETPMVVELMMESSFTSITPTTERKMTIEEHTTCTVKNGTPIEIQSSCGKKTHTYYLFAKITDSPKIVEIADATVILETGTIYKLDQDFPAMKTIRKETMTVNKFSMNLRIKLNDGFLFDGIIWSKVDPKSLSNHKVYLRAK